MFGSCCRNEGDSALQARQCSNQIRAKFVASTCLALCSWTGSWAPWTPSAKDPSGKSSGKKTLFWVRVVLGTTGPRVNTQNVQSWSAWCWMF
uniref:Uncharacterized protein n=1 Tax=Lynx canadensis TaxID=61383 RepID=A0A667GKD2_LYNCA